MTMENPTGPGKQALRVIGPEPEIPASAPEIQLVQRARTLRRLRSPIFIGGAVASVIWLIAAAWYIQTQVGWSSLGIMLPHELGAALSGIATPLLVLWLVIAFIERGSELRSTALDLKRELEALSYPVNEADEKVRSIAQSLREQARALTEASDGAANRLTESRQALVAQTGELTTVSDQSTMRAMQVMASLRRHADGLERISALLASRVQTVESAVGQQAEA